MKNLSTLVQDIYGLLEAGKAHIDGTKLGTMLESRLREVKGGPALRMSSAGEKCVRKLWYKENMPERAAPIPGFTILKFTHGDIAEEMLLSTIEKTDHSVEGRQEEVELYGVKGHIDAIIDGTVCDIKSANSRGMEKFKRHQLERDDPFGYLDQLGLYHEALREDKKVVDKDTIAFVAYDKELGHVVLDRYPVKRRPWRQILDGIRVELAKTEPPNRYYSDEPDGKSGNRQLCMQCRYCDFKEECWRDSNLGTGLRKFIYSNGPRWLTKVMRMPDVKEI